MFKLIYIKQLLKTQNKLRDNTVFVRKSTYFIRNSHFAASLIFCFLNMDVSQAIVKQM